MQAHDDPTMARRAGPIGMTDRASADRASVERAQKVAYWLDERFRVPGTNWRIGFDGLMGLLPGIGDGAAMLIALYIILEAHRLGVPKRKLARMGVNLGLDTTLGAIPILGNIFDFAFKANSKNLKLMIEHLEAEATAKTSNRERR